MYKKGEKLLGVCAVCLLLIYYAVSLLLRLSDKFEQMLSEDVKNGSTRSLIFFTRLCRYLFVLLRIKIVFDTFKKEKSGYLLPSTSIIIYRRYIIINLL